MGNACSGHGGEVHMIILALDYPGTGNELTCTIDGNNMKELAETCGVEDLTVYENNDCNKEAVSELIAEVGSRCHPGDYFVFYYSGHGASVPDENGDEKDGMDEALCLVTEDGKLDWNKFMTDDEFCETVTQYVEPGVNIIVLCDCCHSGTIGDFDHDEWTGHDAISITGCRDSQTSGDIGRGGICTHAMLAAIQGLQDHPEYSVQDLFDATLEKDDQIFNSAQDITIKCSSDADPHSMHWPLIPPPGYKCPLSRD